MDQQSGDRVSHQPSPTIAEEFRVTQDKPDSEASQATGSAAGVASGADAVPDTPDGVAEDNISDVEHGDFARRGRDAEADRADGSTTQPSSEVAPDPTAADVQQDQEQTTLGDKTRRLVNKLTDRG